MQFDPQLQYRRGDTMQTIRVVAAVIRSQDMPYCVFATVRGYGPYKGMWEFPGGKIEAGETPQEALTREIWEELEAKIQVGEKIATIEYDYPDFHLSMDCYWCRLTEEHLVLKEALGAKWLTPGELREVEWLPADRMVIGEIGKKMEKESAAYN